jgi:hypothetical protein
MCERSANTSTVEGREALRPELRAHLSALCTSLCSRLRCDMCVVYGARARDRVRIDATPPARHMRAERPAAARHERPPHVSLICLMATAVSLHFDRRAQLPISSVPLTVRVLSNAHAGSQRERLDRG